MGGFGMARIGGIGIALGAALLLASPALACMPMPFPPVPEAPAGASAEDVAALQLAWQQAHAASRALEDRDWQVKQQGILFDKAKSLVVVRFDHEMKTGKDYDTERFAFLKPVRWVKGEAPATKADELRLGITEGMPCAPMIGDAAYFGKPGGVFLVYLSGNALTQKDMLEAYPISRIMDPRTLAALTGR